MLQNKEIINSKKINIHDSVFKGMFFDYDEKKVHIKVVNVGSESKTYSIEFFNVIGFEMVSCDFWGKSPHVFDWSALKEENQHLIKSLFQEQQNNNYQYSRITDKTKFLETFFTFTSGDRLRIACEFIIFEEST